MGRIFARFGRPTQTKIKLDVKEPALEEDDGKVF